MSLTRNRRHRPNPARGSVAAAGWREITGPRAGAVTDALGRAARSGLGPCAGPRRSKPRLRENGETTFDAVDREPIRANNPKPERSHRPLPRHHELPEAPILEPFVRTYSWRSPGLLRGREQSGQEPLRLCADSWLSIIIPNPSAHDGWNRPGGTDSTRGWVLILPLCSWRIIRCWGRES